MLTQNFLHSFLLKSAQEALVVVNSIDDNLGKYHNLLSKAFVAEIGRDFRKMFTESQYSTCCSDWNRLEQKGVSGEWLLDVAVVKRKQLRNHVAYINEVVIGVESEMNAGLKAFMDDFSKLLVVNAEFKVYINGIEAKERKASYIEKRLELIRSILSEENKIGTYFVCFIDHPSQWVSEKEPHAAVYKL